MQIRATGESDMLSYQVIFLVIKFFMRKAKCVGDVRDLGVIIIAENFRWEKQCSIPPSDGQEVTISS